MPGEPAQDSHAGGEPLPGTHASQITQRNRGPDDGTSSHIDAEPNTPMTPPDNSQPNKSKRIEILAPPPPRPHPATNKVRHNRKARQISIAHPGSEHNIFTHFPQHADCEICQNNKPTRAACKSKTHRKGDALPEPETFGDAITADHKILNEDDESRTQYQCACIIKDRYTHFIGGYPSPT